MKKQCVDIQIIISASIDGEANSGEKHNMFQHLARCAECQEFFGSAVVMKLQASQQQRVNTSSTFDSQVISTVDVVRKETTSLSLAKTVAQIWQRTLSLSYGFATFVFAAALAIGILVATIQQTSNDRSLTSEPDKEYVSVLPSMIVVGHK